jgi:hypothetical protein
VGEITRLTEETLILFVGHQFLVIDPEIAVLIEIPRTTTRVNEASAAEDRVPSIPVVLVFGTSEKNLDILVLVSLPAIASDIDLLGEILRDIDAVTISENQFHARHFSSPFQVIYHHTAYAF